MFSLKKIIAEIVIQYSLFVYVFPFRVYGFDPRLFVFVFFVVLLLFSKKKQLPAVNRIWNNRFVKYPSLIAVFSTFGVLINKQVDYTFIIYPFQILYLLVLSYCVYYIIVSLKGEISFNSFSRYFLSVLFIQSVIAILMFTNENLNSFMFDLQGIQMDSRVITMYLGMRLIGLGCAYFGAGVIYGFGLMVVMAMLLRSSTNKERRGLMFLYVYLFVIGLFFARTCLIGVLMSALYLLFFLLSSSDKKRINYIAIKFIVFIVIITVVLVLAYFSSSALQDKYGDIVKFGFEMFINYAEEGTLSTDSSDNLISEYILRIWPSDFNTYFWGDTRWGDEEAYYMGTDVGYTRLLYYFGVPGLILFLRYQYRVVKSLAYGYKKEQTIGVLFKFTFLYLIVLLVKGYIDISSLLFIYYYIPFGGRIKKHGYERKSAVFC